MSNSQIFDVVVVGGGFAGVVAARDASRAGFKTLLIEARDRLGGRTWYRDSPLGRPLEIGGGFVHWLQPHVWSELVAYDIGIKKVDPIYEAFLLVDGEVKQYPIDDFIHLVAPGMAEFSTGARIAFPDPTKPFPLSQQALDADKVSIVDRTNQLDLPIESKTALLANFALSYSGDPAQGAYSQIIRLMALGGGNWKFYKEAESTHMIDGGTSKLINSIHADSSATTLFSTAIKSIKQIDEKVEIKTDDGKRFTARKAIVTLPINALPTISFEPPLSIAKSTAIKNSRSAKVSKGFKLWIRVKGKVDPFIAFAPYPYPLTMMGWEYEIDGDTILLAFGPDTTTIDIQSLDAVQAAVAQWLPDLEVVGIDSHDWTGDPLSQSTWSMYHIGQLSNDIENLIQAEGNVQIAGSDYALGWVGHIDGAIESARRAVRKIIKELER